MPTHLETQLANSIEIDDFDTGLASIEAGCNPNIADSTGNTLVARAAFAGKVDVLGKLASLGADMNWTDLAGAELLKRVFSQPLPIEKVDLFSVGLERDGPTIHIAFDLVNQLPDVPLKHWLPSEFNRCRLGINCGGVEELLISGWKTNNTADVSIGMVSSSKRLVRFFNSSLEIRFLCAHLVLTGPSVYLDASA